MVSLSFREKAQRLPSINAMIRAQCPNPSPVGFPPHNKNVEQVQRRERGKSNLEDNEWLLGEGGI